MPARKGRQLAKDLEQFAAAWLSNPAARLDFVKLIERVAGSVDPYPMREWIAEEKRAAKSIGLGR
jgi:hypothetical protein